MHGPTCVFWAKLTAFSLQQIAEAQGSKAVARRLRSLARRPFVGVLVQLAGLVGAAAHNGKRAMVRLRGAINLAARIFSALCTLNHCTLIHRKESPLRVWRSNGG